MTGNLREANSVSEDNRVRPVRDHAATNTFIVKCVFVVTLVAAICGWLWLLARGAVAVARAMSSL
jgi:hypothetical protein